MRFGISSVALTYNFLSILPIALLDSLPALLKLVLVDDLVLHCRNLLRVQILLVLVDRLLLNLLALIDRANLVVVLQFYVFGLRADIDAFQEVEHAVRGLRLLVLNVVIHINLFENRFFSIFGLDVVLTERELSHTNHLLAFSYSVL